MKTTIRHKKGYEIVVTSWENDGDNYNTVIYETDDKEHALATVEFANLFKKSCWEGGIGNSYSPNANELKRIDDVFISFYKEHPHLLPKEWDIPQEDDIALACSDHASNLGLTNGEYYTRKLSNLEIYYHPEDVICFHPTIEDLR